MSLSWDSEVIEKFARAQQATGYGHDDRAAGLSERVVATGGVWEALSAEDRDFIDECVAKVDAGDSPTFQHPDSWGTFDQWQAEDAAAGVGEPVGADGDEGDWIGV